MATLRLETVLSDRRARPFQIRLLVLLACFMFFEGYDMQVLSFAAPAIIKEWQSSKAEFGGVFGGAMAGFMLGALLIGNLGDYFGRTRMIVGGATVFGLFTLLSADAHTLSQLFYWRTIAGIGLGGAVPNALSLISEYSPGNARTTSVTLLYVGYTVGSALGGVIAAYLVPNYGWQSVFIVGGIGPLVVAAVLLIGLPESVRFLVLKGNRSERLLKIINRLQPGENYVVLPELVLHHAHEPGTPIRQLFTGGRALLTCMLWLAFILNLVTQHFLTNWLPTVLAGDGVPLGHAIIATSVLQVSGAVGGVLVGRLVDRIGVIAIAIVVAASVPCLLVLGHSNASEILLMSFVAGCGVSIIGGQINICALSSTLYPTRMRATGSGWAYGVGRLGAIIGPMIGGVLLSLDLAPATLFEFAAVPMLVECVALVVLSRQPAARPGVVVRAERVEA